MTEVEKVKAELAKEHWRMNSEMLAGKAPDTNERLTRYAQAAIAALDAARGESADERQAAIVAWLRANEEGRGLVDFRDCWNIAAMIERGEWRK